MDEKTEYIGQIKHIVRLNYDSISIVLFRGMWWNNNVRQYRPSTTYIDDECGFLRILAKDFLPDNLLRHEPFAFPNDCNQVFIVDDRLNPHWKLVVDTDVRKIRPLIPNSTAEEEDLPETSLGEQGIHHAVSDVQIEIDGNAGFDLEQEETEEGNEAGEDEDTHNVHLAEEEIGQDDNVITYHRRNTGSQSTNLPNRFMDTNYESNSDSDTDDSVTDDEIDDDIPLEMDDSDEVEA